MTAADVVVLGGGLAGSEAAWQAASQGRTVDLWEMRPAVMTGAHRTDRLAELVCSNSLGSRLPDRATGILLHELRSLGSLLVECAEATSVPAGGALAVDRVAFADHVTRRLEAHPGIRIVRQEAHTLPTAGCVICATGPLTSPDMSQALAELSGDEHLYFYDAIAPIVEAESLDWSIVYRASRYGKGETGDGDYVNCPLDQQEYEAFVEALLGAERIPLREFEAEIDQGVRAGAGEYFEGCLPIEALAARGRLALAYGPMRPVGLRDPRTGVRPHAVLQLRQEDRDGRLLNLVGFQTNLTAAEQRRVLGMIPGLAGARFVRFGQMHRNTYLNAPRVLRVTLQHRQREDLFIAGQLTGVEGYLGNVATGWLAGWNAARRVRGESVVAPPPETMLGALLSHVSNAPAETFQPMKANLGILPPLEGVPRGRLARGAAYAARARQALGAWAASAAIPLRIAT
jgi:methylenetetrahydrofolate--tRNA-(uracil-5-)-methyltransferase